MNFLLGIDNSILYALSEGLKNKFFDLIMPFASNLNNNGEIWIAIAVILIINKRSKVRKTGIYMLVALAIGYILGEGILKHLFERARPIGDSYNFNFIIKLPKSYSFPSGHTTSSFAAFGVCFFTHARYRYCALVLAVTIAFSRLYLHVHYPSDVLGGIILGLISAKIAVNIGEKFFGKREAEEHNNR